MRALAPALSDRGAPLHLAIDLGAGSGRAMLGGLDGSGLTLAGVSRFRYEPRHAAGHLRWDFAALMDGIRSAIRAAPAAAERLGGALVSVGVDSWGVDYGLVDEAGRLLEEPVSYRDRRTDGMMAAVFASVPRPELFERTGIQCLPINTLYQLAAQLREGLPRGATRLLMMPDLCHHALCRSLVTERTNASTTQLLRLSDGRWDAALFERLGLPLAVMPEIVEAGAELGTLARDEQRALGVGPLRVIAPATHDTASAVAGTPLAKGWAYISSGTWSLVGAELDAPIVSEAASRANFTNESGVGGTVRFLKNVMGLWILEACRREWRDAGVRHDHASAIEGVSAIGGVGCLIVPDDLRFLNPASMIAAIREHLDQTCQRAPEDPLVLTKVVLDSLACRYAAVIDTLETLVGRPISGIHIVGGGSLNDYLNQATADAAGRPVAAGPVEATALGNVLVQAMACGDIGSLSEGRRLVTASLQPRRFEPRHDPAWVAARRRYAALERAAQGES